MILLNKQKNLNYKVDINYQHQFNLTVIKYLHLANIKIYSALDEVDFDSFYYRFSIYLLNDCN